MLNLPHDLLYIHITSSIILFISIFISTKDTLPTTLIQKYYMIHSYGNFHKLRYFYRSRKKKTPPLMVEFSFSIFFRILKNV
jgi:hypothetical protein